MTIRPEYIGEVRIEFEHFEVRLRLSPDPESMAMTDEGFWRRFGFGSELEIPADFPDVRHGCRELVQAPFEMPEHCGLGNGIRVTGCVVEEDIVVGGSCSLDDGSLKHHREVMRIAIRPGHGSVLSGVEGS